MKVPLSWLREMVPVEDDADEIASRLSLHGLAVEEIARTGSGISGVVVGRVLEIADHPDAERLILVRADAGSGPLDIVCGARNFSVGDLVPVALVGATLPGGMEIGRREVRGQVSNGMLCSPRELEISDDHSGILVLDGDLKVGQDVREALGLDDAVLDIDVTPNRPDCLSVLGVAREVAVLYGLPLTEPPASLTEAGPETATLASVRISDASGCPRYVARVIAGISPGVSPWWMRRRLMACAVRPISAVVDVTNYVLLERGHPLHAFDLARLSGAAIVVRRPRKGERITTLDGVERALSRDDVAICDASRPVAVAGVMGGAETEVSEGTRDVLLESASFQPQRVLRTARRLGLRTEASVRFERGAGPEGALPAADRAAALIAEVTGGTVARGAIDAYPRRWKPRTIRLPVERANALIGIAATAEEMAGILGALGCTVRSATRTALRVDAASHRGDLVAEEDLVEEVARIYGFDRVPATLPSGGRIGGLDRPQALRRVARRALLGAGLSEAHTLSLVPNDVADRLGLADDHAWRRVLRVANPIAETESVLRPSLVPGLLAAAQHNVARRVTSVAQFEIGVVFEPSQAELPLESLEVAWVLTGPAPSSWHGARSYDFYDAKGVAESLAEALGVRDVSFAESGEPFPLHPGRRADVLVDGEAVGWVGEFHPRAAKAFDLPDRVAVGRVSLSPFLSAATVAAPGEVSRYPAIERDVAVVVPANTPAAEVERTIRSAGGQRLESVRLFDVYRGEQVGEGSVSLAWALAFRHPERTLTDAEASSAFDAILAGIAARGWSVRA
jgi:phenylalanyl-tRNA synthetase beta chain